MTNNDMKNIIECIDDYVPKYSVTIDHNGKCENAVVVKFNDLMKCLTGFGENNIITEEKKNDATCGPNYEDMYNRCVDRLEEMREENRRLKSNAEIMKAEMRRQAKKLEVYTAALNVVEVMTGNAFDFLHKEGKYDL